MYSQPSPPKRATTTDTRLGIILRISFFAGCVLAGFTFLPGILHAIFGTVVAATAGLFISGLGANFVTMRVFDRRSVADIGLRGGPLTAYNLVLGIVLGGVAAALLLSAPLLAGAGHLVLKPNGVFAWPSLLFYLAALFFGASGEEMIFHGYAFQLLVEKIGPFATVLPVGVIFGILHSFNPNATILSVVNTVLWGILLGVAFLRSCDLWLPIGLHYGWNAVLPLFGVNLSGITIEVTRYFYQWNLAPVWSGGSYGPEGGLLTTIFVIALFFVLMKAPVKRQVARIAPSLNEPL